MYQAMSSNHLAQVPTWATVQPTALHIDIANRIKRQLFPDVQYPPEEGIAAVDSMDMQPDTRFYDTDLKQIARILAQTLHTTPRTFDQWYQMLTTGWAWRLVVAEACPAGFVADERTKECTPFAPQPPQDSFLSSLGRTPLYLIGGLVVGLLLFRK